MEDERRKRAISSALAHAMSVEMRRRNLSPLQVAEASGLSKKTVTRYLSCRGNPSVASFVVLSEAIGVDAGDLIRSVAAGSLTPIDEG